ncbi:MAG: lysophospholipid acyltransferase family protein, partial [Pseudomonadota bacterium]
MSATWQSDAPPMELPRITMLGWVRVVLRFFTLVVLLFGGLAVFFVVRGLERPFAGDRRPASAYIPQWVCGSALAVLGLRFRALGQPMTEPGAQVANHTSWIDIYALFRRAQVFFVAKASVATWPAVGFLSRSVGTVFISRDPKEAAAHRAMFESRLRMGHRLVFFPEGTSTDGSRVLPFKTTLFAAFFEEGLRETLYIQPVSTRYWTPAGMDDRFYCWWGDMTFA